MSAAHGASDGGQFLTDRPFLQEPPLTDRRRDFYGEIFLVSFAVILLEISYTRIFSFKFYYYFTYVIIGLSLLGLGAGGVCVAIFPGVRRLSPRRLIARSCLAASVLIGVGYLITALVQVDAFAIVSSSREAAKLGVILVLLFAPFLCAGVVIAAIFGARPTQIGRLYGADLLGAGLGCVSCIPLIYVLTPPGCVMLSALVLAGCCVRSAVGESRATAACGALLAVAFLVPVAAPHVLPDPIPDRSKTMGAIDPKESPIVFSQWSSVFRVDVMQHPLLEGASYLIIHDGQMGSGLHSFDGDLSKLSRFDKDPRLFPFRLLGKDPNVLIIGSAGGHEILSSLYFKAGHVTGVELNPVTMSLLTKYFVDYSGHLATNDHVTLVNAEGRSFLRRSGAKFDLVWFVAPDTYAAMNAATSGSFVLSESYLYTTQMITEALDHLTDDGVICAMFGEIYFEDKPNRTERYISTAREAFARRGIGDFDRHVLVATSPSFLTLSTILLKKTPFSDDEIAHFKEAVQQVPGSAVQYAHGETPGTAAIGDIVTLPRERLAEWYERFPYDVAPVTDDAPFFWHFARFRDAFRGRAHWELEDAVGERLLIALLVLVTTFAAVCLLLPFVTIRSVWREIPYKGNAVVYFGALGAGFMFLEVSLIQMLTLFLGYPSYSLSVTLFSLLMFTGLGSLATTRYEQGRDRLLLTLLVVLTMLIVFYQFGLSHVVDAFVGSALFVRFAIAVALIAPLGICLGAFMPIGLGELARVTEHKAEFIAWGWAVNGFFAVMSSILSTIVAMSYGFRAVLLVAMGVYYIGVIALMRIPNGSENTVH